MLWVDRGSTTFYYWLCVINVNIPKHLQCVFGAHFCNYPPRGPKRNALLKGEKDRWPTECPVDPKKIKTFLVDVSKMSVFPNHNNLPISIYPSTAYGWRNYSVSILNSISGKAWDFTSLFTSLSRTCVRAISKQVQKAIDDKQSLDNTIVTPQPVTTLLQQHIMSTLCRIERSDMFRTSSRCWFWG
jgi:hypothetical protein